jgi:hypothetical protein
VIAKRALLFPEGAGAESPIIRNLLFYLFAIRNAVVRYPDETREVLSVI